MLKQYEKILLQEPEQKIDLFIPDGIYNKIGYLCKHIPKDEWSGILLYSVDGTIKNPANLKLTVRDIIPMNVGNATYTGYSFSESKREVNENFHIDYCMNNPEALKWKVGMIHSHNVMNVFFSGTDISELEDNCSAHNFYLSLIVNNWMEMCARVAVHAVSETPIHKPSFMAKDELGDDYIFTTGDSYNARQEKMYMYDCNVITNKPPFVVDSYFAEGVERIINDKKQRLNSEKKKNTLIQKSTRFTNNTFMSNANNYYSDDREYNQKQLELFGDYSKDEPELSGSLDLAVEEFMIDLLLPESTIDNFYSLEDALDYIKELLDISGTGSKHFADNVMHKNNRYYKIHFGDYDPVEHNMIYTKMIEILEDEVKQYPFLEDLCKRMTNKMNK